MIFDLTDPIGAIQTIFSILILVEVIQFFDKDDMGAHIQERVEFYRGIFGKVGDGLGKIGAGMKKILGLFSKKEKDQKEDHEHDPKWTKKEYFEHIHEKHPDIWEQFLEEGEGAIWKNYKEDGGIDG